MNIDDSTTSLTGLSFSREGASDVASVTSVAKAFGIRVADSNGKRSSASMLINKMYGWKGYGSNYKVGEGPDQLTLVAADYRSGTPIGTITVGLDRTNGLLVDANYLDEANRLRDQGCKLCEMTKFAIERHINSKHLLAALFHVAYIYAHYLNHGTDLLIEVNPSHVSFYRRLLHFEIYGEEKMCPRVNAPSVLMWLSLKHAQEMIGLHGGKTENSAERSLYPHFFSANEEAGIVERLKRVENIVGEEASA
ncbi:MAG: N-acyl amino acid synthase FeeM domain-containing protein [Burkholderiales bacterium]